MLDDKIRGWGKITAASGWTNETRVVASGKPDGRQAGSLFIEVAIRRRAWEYHSSSR